MSGTTARELSDTTLLIDYLKGVEAAEAELDSHPSRLMSIITWMEVLAGTTPADEAEVRRFLASFEVVPVTEEIAERTVQIRRAGRLKLPDAIILATAQILNAVLVTRNTRDFAEGSAGVRIAYRL